MSLPSFLLCGDNMEINVKPVPELKIKLKDKTYKCSFNMVAMSYMQEAFATVNDLETLGDISPAHMCALVLYAGIKANDEDFTMEEAKELSMQIGAGAYGEIFGMFNKSIIDSSSEEDKRKLKK